MPVDKSGLLGLRVVDNSHSLWITQTQHYRLLWPSLGGAQLSRMWDRYRITAWLHGWLWSAIGMVALRGTQRPSDTLRDTRPLPATACPSVIFCISKRSPEATRDPAAPASNRRDRHFWRGMGELRARGCGKLLSHERFIFILEYLRYYLVTLTETSYCRSTRCRWKDCNLSRRSL